MIVISVVIDMTLSYKWHLYAAGKCTLTSGAHQPTVVLT